MKTLRPFTVYAAFLSFIAIYLLPLNGRLLWQPDETRYAEISREMLARGDWVVPQLLGLRYFEKPVAGYWINNLSQWLFGDSNFAVRFGSVFCTLLSALFIFWMAMHLWKSRSKALLASVIYLSCFLVYVIGTFSVLDPMLTCWLTAAMVGLYRALDATSTREKVVGYLLAGLACGVAFMTKGFLALAIPVISTLPYVIRQRQFKELLCYGLLTIAAAAAISAPWAIAIHLSEPDYWHYFFWVEHIQRFTAENAQHKEPFWFFLPILAVGVLPWLAFLPSALAQGWRLRRDRPELFYLLSWVVMPFIFFSISKGKLPTYILPCFAPLALLIADRATALVSAQRSKTLRINGWINAMVALIMILAVVILALSKKTTSFYQPDESFKIVLLLMAFTVWLSIGLWSTRHEAKRWWLAALCPFLLVLVTGYVVPQKVMAAKQPQYLIQDIRSELAASRYILSNNVGIALGVAWEMKRSDVDLFERAGELSYGLGYADGADRLIGEAQFPDWLIKARRQGNVSLLLLDGQPERLPVPDRMVAPENGPEKDRLVFLHYRQQP